MQLHLTGQAGYTRYFFAFPACPVEGGDERQKSVIPLRLRELTVNCQVYSCLVMGG
jgi:hypothetical protein